MDLTAENVKTVFQDCLFKDGENTDNHVRANCIRMAIGFHPERLKLNDENITQLLSQLPDTFMKEGGGGMSFLNMCDDKNGNQWTGFHPQMEELVALGIASGKMEFLAPKEMWGTLPGGMPYLVIDLK